MESANFLVNLRDGLSRNALRMAASMRKLRASMSGGVDAFKQTQRASGGIKSMSAALEGSVGRIKDSLLIAGAVAGGVAAAVGGIVIKMADFGQRMDLGFQATAKHGASAAKLFEHVQQLSEDLAVDVQGTSQQFLRFLSLGFNPKAATDLIKLGSDFRAFGATGEEVGRIFTQLGQIKSAGVLQGDELRSLAENGLNVGFVYDALGEQLGKTRKEIMKMKEAGKITDDMAFPAIFAAMRKQTGGKAPGEMGKDIADKTLGGMAGRLKAKAQRFFISLGETVTPELEAAFRPLGEMFDSLMQNKDVRQGIVSAISAVSGAIQFAIPFLKEFGSGFVDGFKEALPAIKEAVAILFDGFGSGATWMKNMREFGQTLGKIVVFAGAVIGVMGGMALAAADLGNRAIKDLVAQWNRVISVIGETILFFDSLGAKFRHFASTMEFLGGELVNGLVSGIRNMAGSALEAIGSLGTSIVAKLKGVLGIASPSKEFMFLGEMSGQGFLLGMRDALGNDNIRPLSGPMLDAGAGPMLSSATMPTGMAIHGAGLGSGGNAIRIQVTSHNTFSGTDPDELIRKHDQTFEARMGSIFERLAAQVA